MSDNDEPIDLRSPSGADAAAAAAPDPATPDGDGYGSDDAAMLAAADEVETAWASERRSELLSEVSRQLRAIAEAETHRLGAPSLPPACLSGLAEARAPIARDAHAFAKHGKRSVVGVEDVKLCARRNASLRGALDEASERLARERSAAAAAAHQGGHAAPRRTPGRKRAASPPAAAAPSSKKPTV
eukprot:m51a1_g1418 hypothetical protein (186) ;mRNA; r:51371-52045